jgi:membrane protease YdiL (CAAX protease family)
MSLVRMFWSPGHGRLRAGWRVVLQGVAWLALIFVLQALMGIALRKFLSNPSQLSMTARQSIGMTTEILSYLALIVSLGWAGHYLDKRHMADFGFHFGRAWWIDFAFGLALGMVLMTVVFLFEMAVGWIRVTGTFVTRVEGFPFWPGILLPLIGFVLVGLGEEWWSRGYVMTNLAEGFNGRRLGPIGAVLLATVVQGAIFALPHANNPNASIVSTVNVFLISFLLALGFVLTGELAIPIGLHITWNFFQGNVFGFSVSGNGYSVGSFIGTAQSGPPVWTGGAFGPEAGLVALGAVVVGAVLTLGWVRWRHGKLHLSLGIAEFSGALDRHHRATADAKDPATA